MTQAKIAAELFNTAALGIDPYHPQNDFSSNLGMNLVWTARFMTRNENVFKGLENSIHQRMMKAEPQEAGGLYEIPCIYPENIEKFNLPQLISSNFPIVIKGILRDSFAVNHWSLDYLKEKYGDALIPYLEDKSEKKEYDGTPHYQNNEIAKIELSNLVHSIRSGERKHAISCASIFGLYANILEEVGFHKIEDIFRCQILRPELFIAGSQSSTYFHCAAGGNIFCQLHGKKRWVFVAPWHSAWMYPNVGHNPSATSFISPVVTKKQEKDSSRYPLYNFIPKYTVSLNPGDILFNPPWWWHEVTNLSETIGMPLRVPSGGSFQLTNLLYNCFTIFGSSVAIEAMSKILKNQLDVDDKRVIEAFPKKKI
ncbi:MAG: cupin-like domain-containing protein [Coleofasciculus sp. G1-WW12-02]|uniref:cupin-like domain-containing protein n=1 Tax=Coleofasciculus sp. G1-WW12-02 TaxID=3068483 RepID=UPI0032FB7534